MNRFSTCKVRGYNRNIVERAGIKVGEEIRVNGKACWFVGVNDITLVVSYINAEGKYPVGHTYDTSSGGFHVLKSIDGIEPEDVSVYSQNESKYTLLESEYLEAVDKLDSSLAVAIELNSLLLPRQNLPLPVLILLKPETLERYGLALTSYGLLCCLEDWALNEDEASYLTSFNPDSFDLLHENLSQHYGFMRNFNTLKSIGPIRITYEDVCKVYDISALESVSIVMKPLLDKAAGDPLVLPVTTSEHFVVPYLISTRPDGYLPDMNEFSLERVGSADGGWYSLCPLKADRRLAKGETVSACLVHRRTGELTRIDYTAQADKLDAEQWLADFAQQVAAAGKPITAGGWSDDNEFSSRHPAPRLWCQADYRAFSTAPFSNNLVQLLACNDDFPLAQGQTLSLQVRDVKTQALHEQHLFTAEADSGWSKALCEQVNRDSHLLRAGVLEGDCTVTPGEANNAFWGPQCGELCVTLVELSWWASRALDGTALPSDGALRAWVYDAFSQRLLGHHEWTPSSVQRAKDEWVKAWAEALDNSQVAPYLRVNTMTAMLEQRGDALRIFATLPGDDFPVEGPLLAAPFKAPDDIVLVTVRHPGDQALLHHALFRPKACDQVPSDQPTWLRALARFIETQQWPELCVKEGKQLWLARNAELQVTLDNLGDGKDWNIEDYERDLLNTDQSPRDAAAEQEHFTVEPAEGVTGVTISSLDVELEFRLDTAARDRGYRVMACVPRQSAAKQLREAYISYVETAVRVGNPVVVTFAETGTLSASTKVTSAAKVNTEHIKEFSTLWSALEGDLDADAFNAVYKLAYEASLEEASTEAQASIEPFTSNQARYDAVYAETVAFLGAKLTAAKLAYAIVVASKEATAVWPVSVTSDTITWQGPLSNQAYDLYLDYPESERGNDTLTVGHIGALQTSQFWHDAKPVNFTPAKALEEHTEIGFLCEDYGNTSRSELFDTDGHSEAGVDPRTGLFHAHYPVASLQGLQGQGPVVDLTLHYSALRANEAGVGDGWAWRFSSVQVRDRLLILADGAQVKFTEEQWKQLGEKEPIKLASCVVRSNEDYSEFTLDLPSGRQEVLRKPSAPGSDEEEPNKTFYDLILKALKAIRDKSKPDYPAIPESGWKNWAKWIAWFFPPYYHIPAYFDYQEALNAWESHKDINELKKRIAELEVPFVLLLPSTIESPDGEKLTFEWKRQNGQFLLLTVNSGEEALFKAEYLTPQEKSAQVNMQIWPKSTIESYEVRLELKDYLMRSLMRIEQGSVLQHVHCDYDDDKTLDRVLCGLRELDGSVESVKYQPWKAKNDQQNKARPGLPRVTLHTLLPGDGQQNQVTTYRYDGDFLRTDQGIVSVEYESGPHGAREQHVLVHGMVSHRGRNERFELLRGVASEQRHLLAFTTREDVGKTAKHKVTKGYRYTGAGDEFAELLHALEAGGADDEIKVKDGAVLVERQRELLEWFFFKSSFADRPKLAACITRLLASAPRPERDAQARTVEVATQEEDMAGNVHRLHTSDEKTLYHCYYSQAGNNWFTPNQLKGLNGLQGLARLPTLSCPFLPEHASAPLMAQYQCDPFGNPQSLSLFGYRQVSRGGRDMLELSEVVTIQGVKGLFKDNRLDARATWLLADSPAKLLWRQQLIETTPVSRKKTPSGESLVKQWSVKSTQLTHLGDTLFEMESIQEFEDNPSNKYGIVVRVTSSTEAGSVQFSKELRSRHGRRLLMQVKHAEEVHWQYDALERLIHQTRFLLKTGSTYRCKQQKPDEQTVTTYSFDGKVATHIHANKDISRSYLDGLGRVWRREVRKHGSEYYTPLEQHSWQGLDTSQPLASCEWDYWPGGQAVLRMTPGVSGVGPQAWVREQGGLDGPATRKMLQFQLNQAAAPSAFGFEPFAMQDMPSHHFFEEGLDEQCLFQRSTDYTYCKDGTFEQLEHLSDGAGQVQLQVHKRFDSSGEVVGYQRTVDEQTCTYSLERDALGRVTKLTRPDKTTVEYRYHGLSIHATELKVDGKVVATQQVNNPSKLASRTVGGRTYSFTDDSVTLPDKKSTLSTLRSAEGSSFKANGQSLSTISQKGGTLTLASAASDGAMKNGWEQTYWDASLPGRQWVAQTSLRAKRQACRWLSLRGQLLAELRADGHWQRVFTNENDRVLRTCQDHEEVLYRYDALGRHQSRQAQALKAGGLWQVLSEHDGFSREVTRRFLHNGNECFKQCLTWRGDGRLASKTSYHKGQELRVERFTYDVLDRLQLYECNASMAEHCPQDAQGRPVVAQEFRWDALSNLTHCVTTDVDGSRQTEEMTYSTTDPTQLTAISNRPLTWSANGYLTNDGRRHRFSYNAAGQIAKVSDDDGNVLARYEYDGRQRLAAQYLKGDESTRELRYDGDELIGEIRYDKSGKVSHTTSLSSGLAQYDGGEVRWLIDDPQVGVAGQFKDGALELAPLLPFGEGKALDGLVNGYNGMRRDSVTGHYHAGNGYRCYDPTQRRYAQPDWLSPFGEGGLNDYAHCPDPVNLHDPSGAIMLSRWDQHRLSTRYAQALQDTQKTTVGDRWRNLGFSALVLAVSIGLTVATGGLALPLMVAVIGLMVVAFAFEVASVATANTDPELSRKLGIVSTATGILSAVVGIAKTGWTVLKHLWTTAKHVGQGLKQVARGAKSMWGMVFKRTSRVGSAGHASRAGTGGRWAGRVAWWEAGRATKVCEWRSVPGAYRWVKAHLRGRIAPPEISKFDFSRSGAFGKIGNFVQDKGLLSKYGHVPRSQLVDYLATGFGASLDGNTVRGTVESSIELERKRQEARRLEAEGKTPIASAATSVWGASTTSVSVVPKLPYIDKVQFGLPPATDRVQFWW